MKCIKCGTLVSNEQLSECEKKGTNGIYCIIHLDELFGNGKGYQSLNESKSIGFDNDWKGLDISDLTTFPKDFFTNENIEVERRVETQYYPIIKGDPRSKIIKGLLEGVKYRYRLKPLESMKVTKDVAKLLMGDKMFNLLQGDWFIRDGRKVEIIE